MLENILDKPFAELIPAFSHKPCYFPLNVLFCGIFVLQGSVGMKTLQNIEAFNILSNGGPEMAQFPMSIYPRPMRLLFTFVVPLAGVVYYPSLSFLHRITAVPLFVGWLSPMGGLAFLFLALLLFRRVEKSYISTGS